tara:strand:- start:1718 stop:2077 length:360 start_codon:yes stop_codon:yes gene_type:complete
MNDKDDICINQVVKYIHHYIKFTSKVDNVSYQTSMDDAFDWIVEKVQGEREKELSYNDSMEDDILLTERFKKFTSKVSRAEQGYRDITIDELRIELNTLDGLLEALSTADKKHNVNDYL